eukprot:TRINITY_DN48790_c0_g1_i1.p1 TRINITY_DN48790_c0_g1~~TRINITY_DN48790_c0_g1_i1.p1  ORF type:complete len:201 (+),score=20.51 TRINITY_DN48790_c0_g1_i1:53-655(+)
MGAFGFDDTVVRRVAFSVLLCSAISAILILAFSGLRGAEDELFVMALSSLASAVMIGFTTIDTAFDIKVANGEFQAGDDYYDTILLAPQVNVAVVVATFGMCGPLVICHETDALFRMMVYGLSVGFLYGVMVCPRYVQILRYEASYKLMKVTKNWWIVLFVRMIMLALMGLNIYEFLARIRHVDPVTSPLSRAVFGLESQ